MRYVIWIVGSVVLSSGCTVRGFQNVPDGPTSPGQLRVAASIARAEADALDAVAEEQQSTIDRTISTVREVVTEVAPGAGVPDALWGLLGLGAGWMVPTPGQKRRERVAQSEGRLGNVVLAQAEEPKANNPA